MYYIFNSSGEKIASSDKAPNSEDLASRGEVAIESETNYQLSEIELAGGVITLKVKTDTETFNELKTAKLADIKAKLSATDYKRMKYDDGDLTAEEYEPIKVERHNLRTAYNAIEAATTIEEINNI